MINRSGFRAISQLTNNALRATENIRLNNFLAKGFSKALLTTLAHAYNMPINKFGAMIEPIFEVDGLQKAERLIETSNITIKIHGIDNINTSQPYFIAINHPTGTMDGSVAMYVIKKYRGDLKMLATTKAYAFDSNPEWMIPINTHAKKGGKVNGNLLDQKIEEAIEQNIPIVIAPSGDYAHLDQEGNIVDGRRNRNIIKLANKYQIPILPLHIQAQAPERFYHMAHQGFIKPIKAMMIGMLSQQGQNIHATFGEPYTDTNYKNEDELIQKIQKLKEITHKLRENRIIQQP